MANMCGGKSSASFSIGKKRPRSDSDSASIFPSFRQFLQDISSRIEQAESGPSSSSEDKVAEDSGKKSDESEEKSETLIERVKRQKLGQYERPFLDCIVDTTQITTNFESVCLPEDTVDTLRSLVSLPLLCPEEFKAGILKQHTMSGALLFGPPGTGKTLFAQAVAKESGANMISVKPSDIMDKYVGESEKLVHGLFELARRLHPCIVFIDELDALFGSRTHAGQQSSARWHTSMLTEFMQEMDGLMTSQVVVIGATNRPFDLDDAVLRRLPCRMLVDLPDKAAREEILKIMLREEALAEDVKLENLAGRTDSYSGSDLKNLCVAAAVNAVKDNVTVPWKTGSKKGKERAPGQSFARTRPSASITPVTEPTGATITEVLDAPSATGPDDTTDSSSATPKSTADSTEPSANASSPPSSTGLEPARNKSPFVTSRVLANKHFTHALSQVGASSSADQTTLNEIRTWNTKYGSGGNKMAGILGAGYGGRPSIPPYNPSGAGTGVPGYGARPGGSNLFGGSGAGGSSGVPGIGSSSGAGIPGYGASSGGLGIPGYGGAGVGAGSGISGYPSSTGASIAGITGAGAGAGMGAGMGAGVGAGLPQFNQGGAGGSSMGYTGPGGPGAGNGVPSYSGPGAGMNFGAGALGGGRDMSWLHKSASSGLGLGSDDIDYNAIAAAARQTGAGSGTGLLSESALGKAAGV
ncbi:AAA-domain-containing protein [Ceratobasidium sp. AG-I]|nr:AAA-domain-containing protein [Ceratobasidium sp. AG-I]